MSNTAEQTRFKYSMKNIPIPPRNSYLKKLIEKTESVIKRMRWKAFFFEKNDNKQSNDRRNNENFYPSITEKLLTDSINFAKQYIDITDRDIDIIMHSRKSLLFDSNTAWIKKNNSSFDVTMGSYDGAEVCELVGLFILNGLCNEYGKESIGLYRDDGLAIFRNISGPQTERIRKNITRHFKKHGLKITIQTNLKIVNYLDVTFNLSNGSYYPYRKPNNLPQYINII